MTSLNDYLLNLAPGMVWFLVFLIIWSVIWKGIALWKAVKNNDLPWYIALFILNTAGLLEIFYIYVFSKRPEKKTEKVEK